MAFAIGTTVELRRQLKFGAQTAYAGTRGVITQLVGPQLLWLSLPSLGREVLVPSAEVKQTAIPATGTPKGLAAMCRFEVGDRVTLRSDRQFGNDVVTAGTKGNVTQTVPGSFTSLYWVAFDTMNRDVLCPESDLT